MFDVELISGIFLEKKANSVLVMSNTFQINPLMIHAITMIIPPSGITN